MVKRPDGTTMEGMIWNANHVLDVALDPKTKGIPRVFFQEAKGIVLIKIVEAGFIFSGNVGTGVILMKNKDGKWSAPSAVGMAGVGFGLIFGAAIKDVMLFLMDEGTAAAYAGDIQVSAGGEVNLTVGPWGREAKASADVSNKGFGGIISVAFSKGAFVASGIEGATLGPRSAANRAFYHKDWTPLQILFEDCAEIPEGSLVPELHKKLELLAAGSTSVPSEEEKKKVESLKKEAEKAGEEAKSKHDDIEFVDSAKEAEKEKAGENADR